MQLQPEKHLEYHLREAVEREDYESADKLHKELSAMKQSLLLAMLGDGEKQLRQHLSRRPTDQANLLHVVCSRTPHEHRVVPVPVAVAV